MVRDDCASLDIFTRRQVPSDRYAVLVDIIGRKRVSDIEMKVLVPCLDKSKNEIAKWLIQSFCMKARTLSCMKKMDLLS